MTSAENLISSMYNLIDQHQCLWKYFVSVENMKTKNEDNLESASESDTYPLPPTQWLHK